MGVILVNLRQELHKRGLFGLDCEISVVCRDADGLGQWKEIIMHVSLAGVGCGHL